jgi:hypothetical protein
MSAVVLNISSSDSLTKITLDKDRDREIHNDTEVTCNELKSTDWGYKTEVSEDSHVLFITIHGKLSKDEIFSIFDRQNPNGAWLGTPDAY